MPDWFAVVLLITMTVIAAGLGALIGGDIGYRRGMAAGFAKGKEHGERWGRLDGHYAANLERLAELTEKHPTDNPEGHHQ